MVADAELLSRYARDGSEHAFAEIVRRHIDFVHQTALRQLGGDSHHASDVTQQVFTSVAKNAASLARHRALKGWLFTTARFAAANLVRTEQRRRHREQEAFAMQNIANHPEPSIDSAAAKLLLNDALAILSEREREGVLLRYFEGRDYAEIGTRLSQSADAARLRIDRALAKMQAVLARRGFASGTTALASVLTTEAGIAAPAGLVAKIVAGAIAGVSSGASGTLLALLHAQKIQAGLIAAGLVAGAIVLLVQQRSQTKLTEEIAALLQIRGQQVENLRLAGSSAPIRPSAELAQLRSRVDDLTRQLKKAQIGSLAPGLLPSTAWQNRGRASAGEALETLLWAKETSDYGTLVKLIYQTAPPSFWEAQAVFDTLSENDRSRLFVSNAHDLYWLAAVLAPEYQWCGAQFRRAGGIPDFENSKNSGVVFRVDVQTLDQSGPTNLTMRFLETADGWRWKMTAADLEKAPHALQDLIDRLHAKNERTP